MIIEFNPITLSVRFEITPDEIQKAGIDFNAFIKSIANKATDNIEKFKEKIDTKLNK